MRSRITVTVDDALIAGLNRLSTSRRMSRSRIVENALRSFQRELMAQELAEGYREMAEENQKMAEAYLAAGYEAIR
ncbi:MAG: hypothetical protein A2Z34_06420 [Planctomycetes bacterium RBG_16_59_8]|nr:MAG: hypothetical protein A2Z34_06420 [Planctomycetes bacterium RBG_16_59_8]